MEDIRIRDMGDMGTRDRRDRRREIFSQAEEPSDGVNNSDVEPVIEKLWPESLNTRLLQEAAGHDTDGAKQLISDGADLSFSGNRSGRTPLHKACSTGSADMIELLLQHGVDVEAVDARGRTPLHIACSERRLHDCAPEQAVKMLIDEGADLNRPRAGYDDGPAALHMAAQDNATDIVKLLVREGADINVRDDSGKTPLHKAAAAGWDQMVKLLLERGALVNAVDNKGDPALHLCLESQSEDVMEALLRGGANPNMVDKDGNTVLHLACLYEWKGAVELLLKYGADPEIEDRSGLSALQRAQRGGRSDITRVIRKWGTKAEESADRQRVSDVPHSNDLVMVEDRKNEDIQPDNSTPDQSPETADNMWAGVRRDNGDGFILAKYNNHDVSFDAKLESISPCVHEGKDMHEIQIKLNFMRPYSLDYRIRYANIDVMLGPGPKGYSPNIRGIMPQADRVEVSEQEITSGKTFTVGAAGNGGPSNVNISMEGSKSRRATFKGVRIIHGAIKDHMHASWRLYEEPGSKSGLPEIVRLLLLVHCEEEFGVRLALSVKASHFLTFGIPRTLSAPEGPVYTVPKLSTITAYQQESRLKQMLDVADRAALVIENSTKLEDRFSRAMRGHAKRHLIIQAGMKENHLQEWTDILDDSQTSDFRTLREKLLEIEEEGQRIERPQRRIIRERMSLPDSRSDSDSDFVDRRRLRIRRESYRVKYPYERGEEDTACARKPLESFSAVGPGYHVSRLA